MEWGVLQWKSRVCKYTGCLGLRNIGVWNVAAMGKYGWAVTKKKFVVEMGE